MTPKENISHEWVSDCGVSFLDSKMYSSENKEILCACGAPVTQAIIGINSYMARCDKCWEKKK